MPNNTQRRIYLSVDYDYFSRELEEWDWQHTEARSPAYMDMIWFTRSWAMSETQLEDYAKPHPDVFWETLAKAGYDFSECETLDVADSHMWAASAFLDANMGGYAKEIVNFDAHHDMGYATWAELKRKYLSKHRLDCSNWLLTLLYHLPGLKATVVYPEWKGAREIVEGRQPWRRTKVKDQFRHFVFDEEVLKETAGKVSGVFIAKSSAWLPPWHDEAFARFVRKGSEFIGLPARSTGEPQGVDPTACRSFDVEQAARYVKACEELKSGKVG